MAVRKVVRMGHPVLRQIARSLTKEEIKSPWFENLIQDMIETMHDYGGIGLAAPQIGESVQVAIVDYEEESERYPSAGKSYPFTIVVNPVVKPIGEETQSFWEGCLSVPDLRGLVARPKKIQVDYLDVQGKPQSIQVEGFAATVFQHELDHLQGVLYIDRVKTELGKTHLAFSDEFVRYLAPKSEDDVGVLEE